MCNSEELNMSRATEQQVARWHDICCIHLRQNMAACEQASSSQEIVEKALTIELMFNYQRSQNSSFNPNL